MASQIEISNRGLMLIGEKRLSSLSDDNPKAEDISAGWDMLRDSLIRAQAWHCFMQRKSLAADADAPAWGFSYAYSMDADVVRVLQVGESYPSVDLSDYRTTDNADFRIEGRKIVTNFGAPLKVKWLVNSVEIGNWDASFAKLMAADIADYLQPRRVQSNETAQRIAAWRMGAYAEAAATNAIEEPSDPLADDTFIAAHQQ